MSNLNLTLNKKAIGQLYLKSSEIDSILMSLASDVASNYGEGAERKLITGIGKRHRVRIYVDYKEASLSNRLLKAVHTK